MGAVFVYKTNNYRCYFSRGRGNLHTKSNLFATPKVRTFSKALYNGTSGKPSPTNYA